MKTYTITFGNLTYTVNCISSDRTAILNKFLMDSIGLTTRKFILSQMFGEDNRMSEMIISE